MADLAPIAVSMGDPAGVGPAIIAAAWRQAADVGGAPFFVCGAEAAFRPFCETARLVSPDGAVAVFRNALPVLPVDAGIGAAAPGLPDAVSAAAIIESIELAVGMAADGKAGAVVTAPINKALLYDGGFRHPGHTEFIAELCHDHSGALPPEPVMMLVGGGLRVALATIHVPFAAVPELLSIARISRVASIVHAALKRDFGVLSPRIALCGLNPHAGESGSMGAEERDLINPAAEACRADGVSITDALPGDTVFARARSGAFDAVIAMYHDQGLIPVKTIDFHGGVNTTLGLPIIRTSPDHGTAYDAAAAGTANPSSFMAAMRLAREMALQRAANG